MLKFQFILIEWSSLFISGARPMSAKKIARQQRQGIRNVDVFRVLTIFFVCLDASFQFFSLFHILKY